jgi:FKBP-type peptidyl-prolyl cis-trans isomerase
MKRLAALIAIAMTIAACNLDVVDPNEGDPNPSDPTTETFAASLNIDISKMSKSPNGAYYKDITVGTGAELTANAGVVVMSYLGLLKDGGAFAQGLQQTVIVGNLVGGLRDAMPGMRVGGERVIVIPSALGFGSSPFGGVPRNSTLIYDVRLEQIP